MPEDLVLLTAGTFGTSKTACQEHGNACCDRQGHKAATRIEPLN
jgi:hypothetical protein